MFSNIRPNTMRIELKKFGEILVSRPSGKDAYLAMSAYITKNVGKSEPIEVDFAGVKVITPSWADEVITKLTNEFENVKLVNTNNPTVQSTIKTLKEYSELKINTGIDHSSRAKRM